MFWLSERRSATVPDSTRRVGSITVKWAVEVSLTSGAIPPQWHGKSQAQRRNELFLNPISVKGNGKVGPTGVDHIAAATLKFENDIIAEIVCAVECTYGSGVIIYGTDGTLTVPNPWLPSSPCRGARAPLPPDTTFPATQLIVQSSGSREATEVTVTADRDLFTYEADTVAAHIADRQAPAMSWADTLGNMQLLDTWREEVGVIQ